MHRKLFNIVISLAVTLAIFAGCKAETRDFPELPPRMTENENTETEVSEPVNITPSFTEITVALPYTNETVNYLSRLYYAKINNLMGEDNGYTISLDYLNSLDTPWIINSIQTPADGVAVSGLNGWAQSDSMPDVFLANNINDAIDSGYVMAMDEYLSDNELLASADIPTGPILNCMSDGALYGVPHYISVVLIAGNQDYIPENGQLTFRNSFEDFSLYLETVQDEFELDDDSTLVPFYTRQDLEIFSDLTNAGSDYIEGLIENNLIGDYQSVGNDAISSRTAALWMIMSSEVSMLDSYYPGRIYYASLPDSTNNPVGMVYPLCLSNQSGDNSDFASDFAAFISLDTDAQLLIRRVNNIPGFLPVTKNSQVWDLVSNESLFGNIAMLYEQQMADCTFISEW